MVDFLARRFHSMGISPLILTRGYAGGDESKMLRRRLADTSTKIGVGANRAAVGSSMLQKYGHVDPCDAFRREKLGCNRVASGKSAKIGVAILDDGMQHRSLLRDVEIVMVNGLTPWGNTHFIPRGPMREPLSALTRADIVVIHHADLACEAQLETIALAKPFNLSCDIADLRYYLNTFNFEKLLSADAHSHCARRFTRNDDSTPVLDAISLAMITPEANPSFLKWQFDESDCNEAILQADKAFEAKYCLVMVDVATNSLNNRFKELQSFKKYIWIFNEFNGLEIGPLNVDRLDFSDHHFFNDYDLELIQERVRQLVDQHNKETVVLVTEKDYDRDPDVLRMLGVKVWVLSSSLQIMALKEQGEDELLRKLKDIITATRHVVQP
ncbi:unnamed protein product [Triticum turgidum subsp. durum]|uniref:tetraacyldisaccharide 4'-kinase n=1 Tax=Triticum turgidum subsp. durum TaxID=4567 RepID=A0A9R1NTE3_TRITD|nr:unnamed protein product [Triticum turgidum subsp. durum]